jgi:hypothetical protein
MLYLVLVLVLAAFGLLIAALTTATTLWAWISVAVSIAAAGLLVYDWWKGRRAKAATTPAEPRATVAPAESYEVDDAVDDVDGDDFAEEFAGDEPVEPEYVGPAEPLAAAVTTAPEVADAGEPGEELTDATDLLIVSELDDEVRVVDEHPRYHLVSCSWLVRHATIPIAVSEARQLGFTPCARCGPDARLAGQHRAAR